MASTSQRKSTTKSPILCTAVSVIPGDTAVTKNVP
jgi:hypothetical protein